MSSETTTDSVGESPIYSVIIVGAGPCGLAVAARLREQHPSALFTDSEQARYHWIAKHSHQSTIKQKVNGHCRGPRPYQTDARGDKLSILVLDSTSSEWMSRWNQLFEKLMIRYLRSPMFFHPDPSDRDALLAFTHAFGGSQNAQEICGCVGKELSKHQKKKKRGRHNSLGSIPAPKIDERDRKDYFAPSSICFRKFCDACVDRYGLRDGLIKQETVRDITFGPVHSAPELGNVFSLSTNTRQFLSKTVVLATGAGKPTIPPPFPATGLESASHALDLEASFLLDKELQYKIATGRHTEVLVIGGGLTSAQVVENCIKAGAGHVWLLMRGPFKVKHFDVDLTWMSKFQNHQRATFWSADSYHERMSIVAEARNGGSITPRYAKRLRDLQSQGRLTIQTHRTILTQAYHKTDRLWRITTDPATPDMPCFDYIYFATGIQTRLENLDFLKTMRQKSPVEECSGLPVLTDDLQWKEDVPLFITGRLASLQLGPSAPNLEGARIGAERIVWAIEELLRSDPNDSAEAASPKLETAKNRYMAGIGSKFQELDI